MTAPASADQPRVDLIEALRVTRTAAGARLLADTVRENLAHLWTHGGRKDATGTGRQPNWIWIRPQFLTGPSTKTDGSVMSRLIKSRGVQLRLELLLLFDAQCRHEPGDTVTNVRRVTPHADETYASWQQLVLTATMPTPGTDRGAADLRARQITEAFRALEDQHLVTIPREPGGRRRRYNDLRLLSEASTAEEHPPYVVPSEHTFRAVPVSRHFFTSLWVFALTDTELATYLTLCWLRTRFPGEHAKHGVYIRASDRRDTFDLTRTAWRSTARLHRFRLIDRARDPKRNYRTGNVGNISKRWANREVMPARFTVNDEALEQPALDVIHQVLTAPTLDDHVRRLGLPVLDAPTPAGVGRAER
ncbi:MAG TPA: hypothetical protein VJT31_22225 [Rugosimonospora sp.]|nr:hypothetical protein [Rugosimonospora sp.]